MSLDKSLKRRDKLLRRRNVLSRAERVQHLKEEERWQEGERSVFGLPKVKPQVITRPTERRGPEEAAAEIGAEGAEAEQLEAGAEGSQTGQ